jgi:hypothetical protein
MAELGVHGIERIAPCTVIGRCYKGPLRVGGTFTSFEDETGSTHLVRLEVTRIEAYRRELDEIDEGLTARLTLRGDGAALVQEKGALRGA